MYNFYIRLDGDEFGPFTATQIVNQYLDEMESIDDVEVMESNIGVWWPASKYPWEELVMKEIGGEISQSGEVLSNNRHHGERKKEQSRDAVDSANDEASTGLCILSFLFPIVGWILYFSLSGERAKACAKWAWIGFFVGLLLAFIKTKA